MKCETINTLRKIYYINLYLLILWKQTLIHY